MMIFPLNTWQLILSSLLYIGLFVQGYLLLRYVKKHTLWHNAVADKIKGLSYIFTVLLIVKIAFGIMAIKSLDLEKIAHQAQITQQAQGYSQSYTSGYYAGAYTGHFTKMLVVVAVQHIDLLFAVGFIWLLSFVIKEAIVLKKEQELTI